MTSRKNQLNAIMSEIDAHHNRFVSKFNAIDAILADRRKLRS